MCFASHKAGALYDIESKEMVLLGFDGNQFKDSGSIESCGKTCISKKFFNGDLLLYSADTRL